MRRVLPLLLLLMLVRAPVLSAPAGKARVEPQRVKKELTQILASPEYNRSFQQNAADKALTNLGRAIVRAIKRFFGWIGDHLSFESATGIGIISWVGAWVMVLAFLVLVALVIKRVLGSKAGRTRKEAAEDDAVYEMAPARQLIRQAAKLAEAGDYRAAFKTAYLASIAYLDEIRALRFERSRTNWEYLRELKQGGHEKPHSELQPLTLDFDRKIYGREECAKEDYLRATTVYDRLSGEEAK